MTNSIIQFMYSDNVHMAAIYIDSDAFEFELIQNIFHAIENCESLNKTKGWGYIVPKIISHLTAKYDGKIKFVLEKAVMPAMVIHKYQISIDESLYKNEHNKLQDYCTIKCLGVKDGFDGLLKEFLKVLKGENIDEQINSLKNELSTIKAKIKELKNTQKQNKKLQ